MHHHSIFQMSLPAVFAVYCTLVSIERGAVIAVLPKSTYLLGYEHLLVDHLSKCFVPHTGARLNVFVSCRTKSAMTA